MAVERIWPDVVRKDMGFTIRRRHALVSRVPIGETRSQAGATPFDEELFIEPGTSGRILDIPCVLVLPWFVYRQTVSVPGHRNMDISRSVWLRGEYLYQHLKQGSWQLTKPGVVPQRCAGGFLLAIRGKASSSPSHRRHRALARLEFVHCRSPEVGRHGVRTDDDPEAASHPGGAVSPRSRQGRRPAVVDFGQSNSARARLGGHC